MNFLLVAQTILFVDFVDHSFDSCLTSDMHALLSSSDRPIHRVSSSCNPDNTAASSRNDGRNRQEEQPDVIRRCPVKCNMLKRTVVALSDLGLGKFFPQSRPC